MAGGSGVQTAHTTMDALSEAVHMLSCITAIVTNQAEHSVQHGYVSTVSTQQRPSFKPAA